MTFNGQVNIVSKDPGNPAVIDGLTIRGSEGLNFTGVDFKVDPAGLDNQFIVYESKNVHFTDINIHGTLNGNPVDDQAGLMIRLSSDVTVRNSEFHELAHGLTILESNGVTVEGNTFHDIQSDGVRGSGVSDVNILNNYFTDFFPQTGDHPDAIQLWEGTVNTVSRNIMIDGNVIARGEGGLMQGIFLRGPLGTFENVTITNNTVAGGMTNGIFVASAKDVVVGDNTVVGYGDDKSWIRIEDSSQVVMNSNDATKYIYGVNVQGLTETGNSVVGYISTESLKALEQWIEGDHSTPMPTVSYESGSGTAPVPPTEPTQPPPSVDLKIVGSTGADRLVVSGLGDTLIEAGAGDDRLTGGSGQNTLVGGTGNDTYYISDGDDLVVEGAGAGNDIVVSSVNYTLTANVEQLELQTGATIGTGNALGNTITGTTAGDQLSGLGGDDRLVGGGGKDLLRGGDGADKLTGGAGADTLNGGAGADVFTFGPTDFAGGSVASMDRIEDFSAAQGDRIHLSTIDASTLSSVMNDKFAFIGTSAFHGNAGELRYQVSGGDTYVYGDLNGDRVADLQIHLVGVTTVTAENFVL